MSEKKHNVEIDLGDDLLENTIESVSPIQSEEKFDPQDKLKSAEIFFSEGFLEEAKRVLREIIRKDPRSVQAKRRLEAIQNKEIESLLKVYPESDNYPEQESPDRVTGQLLKDLGMEDLNEESEFLSAEELKSFEKKIDTLYSNSSDQERIDLGIAFLTMGLVSLAENQFRIVASHSPLRKSHPKQPFFEKEVIHILSANYLLILTLLDSGKHFEAVLLAESIACSGDLSNDLKVHFYYLLGRAQEGLGNFGAAKEFYHQAALIDSDYRDVKDRINSFRRAR